MKLTAKAVVFPALIIIAFVIAPRIAIRLIPAGIEKMIRMVFDVNMVISTLTAVGIVAAAMSFVKNITDSWSPANLLAAIASELIGLYVFIFFIGLGDVAGLGVARISIPAGLGATMFWDFKFFVLCQFLICGLSIVKESLNFYSSRKGRFTQPAAPG